MKLNSDRPEKRSRPFRPRALYWITLVFIATLRGSASASADGCDWTGSGLEENGSEEGGVRPVYLRCSQGSVTWLYPRGALRVLLRYGTKGKEFQGCLKLAGDYSGANIYVERHRSLELLSSGLTAQLQRPQDKMKRHCFESRNGQVALFLEADPSGALADPLRRQTATFHYDLQLQSIVDADDTHPNALPDPWQECRPCSVKETLELFCSSDFVARGSISSIYNDIQLERTLMTVRASRVIRQASSVFTSHASADAPARWSRRKRKLIAAPSKWKGMDGVEEDLSDPAQDHVATLHVPLSCKVKIGGGQFVFMGRKRLGDAVLFCAPRLEEWQQWIVQANIDGTAQCRLES